MRKKAIALLALIGCLILLGTALVQAAMGSSTPATDVVQASMASTSYCIATDVLASGGGPSASASYKVNDIGIHGCSNRSDKVLASISDAHTF